MAQAPTSPPSAASPLLQGFFRLSNAQKVVLLVGLAAVIAASVAFLSWARSPDYRVLFSNLTDRDGGAVVAALQQINVPYRMSEGGNAILVPSDRVYDARLRLAQQGLPRGGSIGFELLENQRIGTSQFVEQVNYQRALEGELARTVQALGSVQGARVHLAIPRPSVFVRDQQKPSASVLVSLYPGRALEAAQLAGIAHLVSSSVPELAPSAVTIVDQAGNLLTSGGEPRDASALDAGQLKHLLQVEQSYVRRIENILTPIVGPGNVRAQVTVDLDFSKVEQTAETFKPNPSPQQAIRSQQTVETVGEGARDAGGVPGALSNQPPGAASAPINAPPAAAKGAPPAPAAAPAPSTHRESTTNFEVDKTITYTRSEVGALRRVSAAVVVNHRREVREGKAATTPIPDAEVTKLTELVKQAIGFSEQRGDTVNLVNAPFTETPREQVEGPTLVSTLIDRLLGNLNTLVWSLAAVIAALLVYSIVIRPVLRDLASAGERELAYAPPPGSPPGAAMAPGAAAAAQGPATAAPIMQRGSFEAELQVVKDLARQEPQIVANVVKDWVGRE